MAQAARQAMTIAPRHTKPPIFGGTDAAWRVLCDLYPSAETPEIIMAVVEYCAAKRLDPFKRPVHVIPMWNAKLRRRVQTIMRGINEIEIVAARTGAWAGMDLPQWGPEIKRTFRGPAESDDDGDSKRTIEMTLRFPVWCAVTVYRLVGGERRAFTAQLFWEESYGTAAFRSEVPNERWSKAPHQMLHKSTKAAVLRTAFPEEGLGYAAEEMEDRQIETGGVTIEGNIDHGDPGLTDSDRKTKQAPPPNPPGEATAGLALLEEPNTGVWLKNLETLLKAAATEAEVNAISEHRSVRMALEKAPSLIRRQISDLVHAAREKVAPPTGENDWDTTPGDDPIAELIAEIEAMDAAALDGLASNAAWRAKTRDLFPLDADRIEDAIAARKAALKNG